MPTELIEACAEYLSDTDLLYFRLSCKHADAKTLRIVGERFFSTFQTNLMRSDIEKLDVITPGGRLARYVKAIRVQDEEEKVTRLVPYGDYGTDLGIKNRDQERENTRDAYRIWPRKEAGVLGVDRIVVAKFMTILKEGHLSLDSFAIYDYYDSSAQRNTRLATTVAGAMISYAQLAITSVRISITGILSQYRTLVTYNLDRTRQGDNVGLSLLRKAEVHSSGGGPSSNSRCTQVFHIAPALEDLQLELWGRADALLANLFHQPTPLMKLKTVRLKQSDDIGSLFKGIVSASMETMDSIYP
ncbi:hypothetical protein J4E83_006005 [Alternaria metachromatica]|uniref:uncharacterized protein n=1 Tax=Alternaria metachromatica TaxID=283354 RepID=UPI0020C36039|nr:uncharacterized protein J4E83_006005 [Alternaria metachromatica]KAI4619053.1 hypothetical protein J4E83_006005 [Alternaria metachromatica]